MENKYYTPQIEEFCVGFRYERNEPHRVYYKVDAPTEYKWCNKVWDDTQISIKKLKCEIFENKIRVK